MYNVFIVQGELGPSDDTGLLASKGRCTAVRGEYYGLAAVFGRTRPFAGLETIILLYDRYAKIDTIKAGEYPFFMDSSLSLFSLVVASFLLAQIGQECIKEEGARPRAYVEPNRYDVRTLRLHVVDESDDVIQSQSLGT